MQPRKFTEFEAINIYAIWMEGIAGGRVVHYLLLREAGVGPGRVTTGAANLVHKVPDSSEEIPAERPHSGLLPLLPK